MSTSVTGISMIERRAEYGDLRYAPVLVLLHGWGLYAEHLFDMTKRFDPRLHVVALRAPIRMGPGAYRWFDFVRTPSAGPIINDAEEENSLASLIGVLGDLKASRGSGALYLLGHSQGGTMSLSVCLRRPGLVAGCVNVNGRILAKASASVTAPDALTGMRFFCGHGVHNPIVPLALGHATRDRLRELGADVAYREYPIGHEITPESLADASAWLSGVLSATGRP